MSMEQIVKSNIPLQSKNPNSTTEEIDIVGGNSVNYTNPERCRGNGFLCTEAMNVKEFMAWHSVTVETQMWMTIYEGDSPQGDYNLVSATDISPAPVGTGWYSSGVIDFPLVAGKYYLLLSSFEEECGYFCDQDVEPFPYPVTFGEALGGAGAGWSPSCNFPPDETQSVFGAWEEDTFYYQQIITEYFNNFDNDLGIKTIVSPVSGPSLTSTEAVTVEVKNYGTIPQSDISVSYTLNGGIPVVETISGTLNAGETIVHTFAQTIDISYYGAYEIEACTNLEDENPDNNCKLSIVINETLSYCGAATTNEEEFIANVLCGSIDNASGWQGGIADYTAMSTEIEAGMLADISIFNGNPDAADEVIVWVDWNDDYEFEIGGDEEFVLISDGTGAVFTGTIAVPADATNGMHRMRIRMNNGGAPEPCGSSSYGEVEEYTITVSGGVIGAVFEEDFNGYFFSNGWSTVGSGQANWGQSQSNNAGGTPAEVEFYWNPTFSGNSKLVSPIIPTSGISTLTLEFKQMVSHYSDEFLLAVETSSDGISWNEVWSETVLEDIPAETMLFEIDNADVGSDNFQIAFTFNGQSSKCEAWYIDDVVLMESFGADVAAIETNIPAILSVGNDISPIGKVINLGDDAANFDVTLNIFENGTSIYSEIQTVTNLENLETAEVIFPDWTTTEGGFEVTLTTSLADDENPDNDMITELVQVTQTLYYQKPLFEIFTSSTCGPCVLGNIVVDSILHLNPNKYTLIKHQMNWPGAGDPYFTAEAGARGSYYDIHVVPSLFVDAVGYFPLMDFTQEKFLESQGKETGLEIEITEATINDDNLINIVTNLNTKVDYPAGLSCHIVVIEKTTYDNTGTNGEEEFYNVMMKMLPDASGEILGELTAGIPTSLTYSYDMDLTFMETKDDLEVIVFVQDDTDKSVLQSETMDVEIYDGIEDNLYAQENIILYPNPAKNLVNINSESLIEFITVYNFAGQVVFAETINNTAYQINSSKFDSGIYLFQVDTKEGRMAKCVIIE